MKKIMSMVIGILFLMPFLLSAAQQAVEDNSLLYYEEPVWFCTLCQKNYSNKGNLTAHVQTVHRAYAQEHHVTAHNVLNILSMYPVAPTPAPVDEGEHFSKFPCTVAGCTRRFPRKSFLVEHLDDMHGQKLDPKTDLRPYVCHINNCFKEYTRPDKLKNHQKREHSTLEESLLISTQELAPESTHYTTASGYSHDAAYLPQEAQEIGTREAAISVSPTPTHSSFEGTEVVAVEDFEKFTCTVAGCLNRFGAKAGLKYHLKNAHGIEELDPSNAELKPYVCSINNCDKNYGDKFNLERHQQREHGYVKANVAHKKFSCTMCEKAFKSRARLRAHRQKFHPVLLPVADYAETEDYVDPAQALGTVALAFMNRELADQHVSSADGVGAQIPRFTTDIVYDPTIDRWWDDSQETTLDEGIL